MKITSHIRKTTVAALCVLALSPALLFAADTTPPYREGGIIKSVDTNAHTLVISDRRSGTDQTFLFNDQTKFREHDQDVTASDLKVGEHVFVHYAADGSTPTLESVYVGHFGYRGHYGHNCSTNTPGT